MRIAFRLCDNTKQLKTTDKNAHVFERVDDTFIIPRKGDVVVFFGIKYEVISVEFTYKEISLLNMYHDEAKKIYPFIVGQDDKITDTVTVHLFEYSPKIKKKGFIRTLLSHGFTNF